MQEFLFFVASSFWAGAAHAATPGHGKTIAAAYIVGARGKPIDAVILGIFVTLSHTSGIVLVGLLASLGSTWLRPQRIEAYLAVAVAVGVLVIVLGLWMLWVQRDLVALAMGQLPTAFRRGSEECRRTCRRGRELRNTTLGKRSAPKKLQRSSRNSAAPPDPANEAASSSAACRPRARRSSARFCLCDYVAWDTAAVCQVMSSRSGTIDGASSRS
jgi:High-affinity nickel-transport protein